MYSVTSKSSLNTVEILKKEIEKQRGREVCSSNNCFHGCHCAVVMMLVAVLLL